MKNILAEIQLQTLPVLIIVTSFSQKLATNLVERFLTV